MRNLRRFLILVVGIALGMAVLFFAMANSEPVKLKFLRWETTHSYPVWGVMFFGIILGSIYPLCLLFLSFLTHKGVELRQRRQIHRLEAELKHFRNLPLTEEAPAALEKPFAAETGQLPAESESGEGSQG